MRVMHLSEKDARSIASGWAKALEGKSHECPALWDFIRQIKGSFSGLTWREDQKCFYKGL